jgi:hypothetical protein
MEPRDYKGRKWVTLRYSVQSLTLLLVKEEQDKELTVEDSTVKKVLNVTDDTGYEEAEGVKKSILEEVEVMEDTRTSILRVDATEFKPKVIDLESSKVNKNNKDKITDSDLQETKTLRSQRIGRRRNKKDFFPVTEVGVYQLN